MKKPSTEEQDSGSRKMRRGKLGKKFMDKQKSSLSDAIIIMRSRNWKTVLFFNVTQQSILENGELNLHR